MLENFVFDGLPMRAIVLRTPEKRDQTAVVAGRPGTLAVAVLDQERPCSNTRPLEVAPPCRLLAYAFHGRPPERKAA